MRSPWSPIEEHHAATLSWAEFSVRYPERGYDAYETKRRRVNKNLVAAENRVEGEGLIPVPAVPAFAEAWAQHTGFRNAFCDIETTFGSGRRLLSAAIADDWGNVILLHHRGNETTVREDLCAGCGSVHVIKEIGCQGEEWIDDSVMANRLVEELEPFHVFIGWNSKRFDVPTMKAREILGNWFRQGEAVRAWAPQMHLDLMYQFAGGNGYYGGKALAKISTVFASPHRKTELNPLIWDKADHGDEKSYDLIIEHNIADVLVTRDVFVHARPQIRQLHRGG